MHLCSTMLGCTTLNGVVEPVLDVAPEMVVL